MSIGQNRKPMIMGGAMGLMMMGMLHMWLVSDSARAGTALAAFVAAHVIALLVVVTLGWTATKFFPTFRMRLASIHKPGLSHLVYMLIGTVVAAALVHIFVHGGL